MRCNIRLRDLVSFGSPRNLHRFEAARQTRTRFCFGDCARLITCDRVIDLAHFERTMPRPEERVPSPQDAKATHHPTMSSSLGCLPHLLGSNVSRGGLRHLPHSQQFPPYPWTLLGRVCQNSCVSDVSPRFAPGREHSVGRPAGGPPLACTLDRICWVWRRDAGGRPDRRPALGPRLAQRRLPHGPMGQVYRKRMRQSTPLGWP